MNEVLLKIKNDLLNEIKNDKYYLENDLNGWITNPSLSHKDKVLCIKDTLGQIALSDLSLQLVEMYFKSDEPKPKQQLQTEESPAQQNGQSHKE